MAEFFAELKRRHIYRVGAAYVVVAWALAQGVALLSQIFQLPSWLAQPAVILLVIGFPVALIVAWMIESKPHEAVAAAVKSKPTILDGALFAALISIGILIGYQQLAPRQAGVEAARSASLNPAGTISLAVLPFSNLSSDPEQEFFSDGMTEEITAALARVPDLRVVGRTSAFQFKGQNQDLRAIGQALSATHLIEGSVRKAGDRVRITVQLIKSDDGTHVWSENYDRQLTDVFAIQEDIARTVTASLNMSLGLRPGENLVSNRNIDPESYEKLLRAKALVDTRSAALSGEVTRAAVIYEEVTARNPGYAPAWGRLADAYFLLGNGYAGNANLSIAESREQGNAFRAKGEAAAQRGLQADPNLARGYSASALFSWSRAKPLEADELFLKALSLDPVAPDALDAYAIRLGAAGRVTDSLAITEKGRAVEPFLPALSLRNVTGLWLKGENDAAIAVAKTIRPDDRAPLLAMIYASMGRLSEAADALMELASDPNSAAAQAARLLRTAPSKIPLDALPRLPAALEFTYLYVGAPERAIATYERRAEVGFLGGNTLSYVWHPSYAPVRKTERFKTLVRKTGLVDYWRAKGWPEFCHPVGADDFACE